MKFVFVVCRVYYDNVLSAVVWSNVDHKVHEKSKKVLRLFLLWNDSPSSRYTQENLSNFLRSLSHTYIAIHFGKQTTIFIWCFLSFFVFGFHFGREKNKFCLFIRSALLTVDWKWSTFDHIQSLIRYLVNVTETILIKFRIFLQKSEYSYFYIFSDTSNESSDYNLPKFCSILSTGFRKDFTMYNVHISIVYGIRSMIGDWNFFYLHKRHRFVSLYIHFSALQVIWWKWMKKQRTQQKMAKNINKEKHKKNKNKLGNTHIRRESFADHRQ